MEAIRAGVVAASTAIMGNAEQFSAPTRASAGRVLGSLAQILQGRAAIAKAKSVPVLTSSCLDEDEAVSVKPRRARRCCGCPVPCAGWGGACSDTGRLPSRR